MSIEKKLSLQKVVLEFLYISSSCKSIYTESSHYYQKFPAILSHTNVCLTHLIILVPKAKTAMQCILHSRVRKNTFSCLCQTDHYGTPIRFFFFFCMPPFLPPKLVFKSQCYPTKKSPNHPMLIDPNDIKIAPKVIRWTGHTKGLGLG